MASDALPLTIASAGLSEHQPPATLWGQRIEQLSWGFVALGILFRVIQFLLREPIWLDESFIAANLLNHDFRTILGPLDHSQVAAPLFLWSELAITRLFGFNEYTLRLIPLLCGCASLLVFQRLAWQIVPGMPACLAVATLAISYYPIRHATEVKPYAGDLLACLLLLTLTWDCLHQPRAWRSHLLLLVLVPLCVFFSLPTVFVCSGIGLALAWHAWHGPTETTPPGETPTFAQRSLLLVSFGVVFAVAFGTLYFGFLRPIYAGAGTDFNTQWWADYFPPPFTQPLNFVTYFVSVHVGRMFGYPIGADGGGSILTFAIFAIGAGVLIAQRRTTLVILLLGPILMTFVAALLKRYPYGGSGRIFQHFVPAICVLLAVGACWLICRRPRELDRQRLWAGCFGLWLLLGIGGTLFHVARPYRMSYTAAMRDFARQFWHEEGKDAELACLLTDLKQPFMAPVNRWSNVIFLVNREIYRPADQRGDVEWNRLSAKHPLRCVVLRRDMLDDNQFRAWLATMEQDYALTGYKLCPLLRHEANDASCEIFEFVPENEAQHIAKPDFRSVPVMVGKPFLRR